MTGSPDLVVRFEPPDRVFSINERLHWAPRAQLTANWRGASEVYARKAKRALFGDELGAATVRVHLPFRNKHRRDPHNYVGTVVKAIVDGLVDAKLFPDDTAEWVSVAEPVCYQGDEVRVEITRRVVASAP
jgi:hypothetical protein